MRINPKTVTLDMMERASIVAALETRLVALARTCEKPRPTSFAGIRKRDRLEMEAARVTDLINLFRSL